MKHQISISTIDALVINKALRTDLNNEVDNEIARQIIDRINLIVEKDLKRRKQPTDLTNKCGSCKWARPRTDKLVCYINCVCPSKKPNWFARTNKACKKYEKEQKNGRS